MTIWEISEKADYIAQRHQQLQDQWHLYCNSLIQGITLSKARLHHAMSCAAQGDMRFVLFGHFDAPRDKCAHFREINGIAAAFQYWQKNYNPTASSSL